MSTAQLKPTSIKELYFNHPTMTQISGNPTYSDLQNIYKQSKVNAQSVPSTHGIGFNGYLSFIVNATAYARINS